MIEPFEIDDRTRESETGWQPEILPLLKPVEFEPIEYYSATNPFPPAEGDLYDTAIEPPPIVDIFRWPVEPSPSIRDLREDKSMYPYQKPVCNCITEPCDCDVYDGSIKYLDPSSPPPIVKGTDPLIIKTTASVPNTVGGSSGGTAAAGDKADDGETMMIFGYPWYYAVGAGLAGLFILSSMDGKK